jgi:hypothetical protein
MSATMVRQRGRVPLEQSDMCMALNMGEMSTEGFSSAAIEKTKYHMKKPRTEIRQEKIHGVEFPRHTQVEATIDRHPAMLRPNRMSGWLPCQNGTGKDLHTR